MQPSLDLLRVVQSGLVAQGRTLTGVSRQLGVKPSNARSALLGGWRGPKAAALVDRLLAEASIR